MGDSPSFVAGRQHEPAGKGSARRHTEFAHGHAHVAFHGLDRQEQLGRDLVVGASARGKLGHLKLPWREFGAVAVATSTVPGGHRHVEAPGSFRRAVEIPRGTEALEASQSGPQLVAERYSYLSCRFPPARECNGDSNLLRSSQPVKSRAWTTAR